MKRQGTKTGLVAGVLASTFVTMGTVALGAGDASAATSFATTPSIFRMTTEASGPFPDSFNPFIASTYAGYVNHLIYEPLYQVNFAELKTTPWLATAYKWSNGGRTLAFTVRSHVQWSDGSPLTSSDVAFTFNMMKRFPATNVYALPIASASAQGTQAIVRFRSPAYSQLDNILYTLIVPEATWSKVPNPATFEDSQPVGTGPYVLQTFTPQVITLAKNQHYWQAGAGAFQEVQAVQEDSNGSTAAAIETGQIDWTAVGLPDVQTLIAQHKNLVLEAAPFVDAPIIPNTTVYPLNLAPVRQAISEALNRPLLFKALKPFLDQPIWSKTGLVQTSMGSLIAPQYRNARLTYSTRGAKKLLEGAGFKMGGDGIFNTPEGKPFQLQFLIPATYGNWVALAPLIQSELKAAGIGLTINALAETTWAAQEALGHFDLSMDSQVYTNPYGLYSFYFGSKGAQPVGKVATTDYGRYESATTEKLLDRLSTSAPGTPAATSALNAVEGVMVNEMPIIPMFANSQQGVYNTTQVRGFPTRSNLYAFPSEINTELIVLHLHPVS